MLINYGSSFFPVHRTDRNIGMGPAGGLMDMSIVAAARGYLDVSTAGAYGGGVNEGAAASAGMVSGTRGPVSVLPSVTTILFSLPVSG